MLNTPFIFFASLPTIIFSKNFNDSQKDSYRIKKITERKQKKQFNKRTI